MIIIKICNSKLQYGVYTLQTWTYEISSNQLINNFIFIFSFRKQKKFLFSLISEKGYHPAGIFLNFY